MKISLNWIKDYVKLPDDLEIPQLMHDLTMTTVEVEGAEIMREKYKNITLGVVTEVLPHPNADKLKICRTDLGAKGIKEIVCGGINLAVGMKVIVAEPGSMVRWHGQGEPVEIKNTKLRGADSYGMICASSETEMFDLLPFEEERTIADISFCSAPAGTPIVEALGIDDVILEIDNKSLTNRPDLWGHYGIARELSAIYDTPLKPLPTYDITGASDDVRIRIEDPRCFRYIGTKIENVSNIQSPFDIKSRIWLVGMRPINAIVDITNYVMLATGEPTHAFDSNNISGGITVRPAAEGEKLTLLNGAEISLSPEDMVIADDDGAVGLAGIMGGDKDSVHDDTSTIILEAASFAPISTRRTAHRYELRTEASMRFEKGIDTERAKQATHLALDMLSALFPDMKVTAFNDVCPRPTEAISITVSLDWLARRMGKCLSDATVTNMLERLGFGVKIASGSDGTNMLTASVPSWRATGDVSLPDDIMEETARLYGYENFEQAPISAAFECAVNQREHDLERRIREYLSFRCAMQEVFTYPWVKDSLIEAISADRDEMLEISSPPAPDEKSVRTSLLPNLLGAVSHNLKNYDSFEIYELAQVFFNRDFSAPYDPREELPSQHRSLAGAFAGRRESLRELFSRAKGVIEGISRFTHMEPLSLAQKGKPAWADETVQLDICIGERSIGHIALLSRKSSAAADINPAFAVVLFELDVDALEALKSRDNRYRPMPKYPQVEYDISMLFDESVKWQEIEGVILGKKGPDDILRSVSFVDEYRGRQVESCKKSITLRLLLGSDSKTLTSEEIEKAAAAVTKRLSKQLGGEIRG